MTNTPPQKPPRREPPQRMSSALTLVLVVTMMFLIWKGVQNPPEGGDDRNFQNLRALAYKGEVERMKTLPMAD